MGRTRGAIQTLTFGSAAWPDGGSIPPKYTQAGDQVSPPLTWTNVPETAVSFVLVVHDVDAAAGNGNDDILHWMLWNIPAAARNLPEGVPQGSQLPDGTRRELPIVGTAHGLNQAPAALSGFVSAYTRLETLESLGVGRQLDRLFLRLAEREAGRARMWVSSSGRVDPFRNQLSMRLQPTMRTAAILKEVVRVRLEPVRSHRPRTTAQAC